MRELLIQQNMGLVDKVANQMARRCRTPFEDLQQIGTIGLIRAVEEFDPREGHAFSSYAVPKIRGEMLHHQRDNRGLVKVPRQWQEFFDEVRRTQKEFVSIGRNASMKEVAIALGKSGEEWDEIAQAVRYLPHTELSELINDPPDELDMSVDTSAALKHLSKVHRYVVLKHVVDNIPIKRLATNLQTTESDVQIFLDEGLEQLKHHLEDSLDYVAS